MNKELYEILTIESPEHIILDCSIIGDILYVFTKARYFVDENINNIYYELFKIDIKKRTLINNNILEYNGNNTQYECMFGNIIYIRNLDFGHIYKLNILNGESNTILIENIGEITKMININGQAYYNVKENDIYKIINLEDNSVLLNIHVDRNKIYENNNDLFLPSLHDIGFFEDNLLLYTNYNNNLTLIKYNIKTKKIELKELKTPSNYEIGDIYFLNSFDKLFYTLNHYEDTKNFIYDFKTNKNYEISIDEIHNFVYDKTNYYIKSNNVIIGIFIEYEYKFNYVNVKVFNLKTLIKNSNVLYNMYKDFTSEAYTMDELEKKVNEIKMLKLPQLQIDDMIDQFLENAVTKEQIAERINKYVLENENLKHIRKYQYYLSLYDIPNFIPSTLNSTLSNNMIKLFSSTQYENFTFDDLIEIFKVADYLDDKNIGKIFEIIILHIIYLRPDIHKLINLMEIFIKRSDYKYYYILLYRSLLMYDRIIFFDALRESEIKDIVLEEVFKNYHRF